MNELHQFAAFRGCTAHDRRHGIRYAAVTEAHGPLFIDKVIKGATRVGMFCVQQDDHTSCFAVLDIEDRDGDIMDDRCIPTAEEFEWWRKAIELRATSSDCPVDEPAAYAETYPYASTGGAR